MKRIKESFLLAPGQVAEIKRRMLQWADRSNILLFLDSNQYRHTRGRYECICAVDCIAGTTKLPERSLQEDWLFGHISYDYKNRLEALESSHQGHFRFPELSFFCPAIVCYIPRNEDVLYIESAHTDPKEIWQAINATVPVIEAPATTPLLFQRRMDQGTYLLQLAAIKEHIRNGDCYELNFCNEAFCEGADINPRAAFERLNHISPAPFAAYYKREQQYLMCSSPERYLYKDGTTVLAQPIKGTAARGADAIADEQQKIALAQSIKERAEHVMIVDLMRNDLARFCKPGSIAVDDLYGIHSFPRVHQMISTVSGQVQDGFHWTDAIRQSFPMGSMTGAPKVIVMQLIEKYEQARRELFSGTVGYISPDGDFDFNVVIRSIFYNADSRYLSYQTGGAITWDSDPVQEWEETLLKAAGMEQVFR